MTSPYKIDAKIHRGEAMWRRMEASGGSTSHETPWMASSHQKLEEGHGGIVPQSLQKELLLSTP